MRHQEEVFDTLKAFSRDDRFREIYETAVGRKEAEGMPIDSWFDDVVPAAEARGEARGKEIGEAKSEQRMQQLFTAMEKAGRIDDFHTAMKDTELLHQLYEEFEIE